MSDVTMVILSLTLVVLTWTVVRINERISETQRMIKQMGNTKENYAGSEINA